MDISSTPTNEQYRCKDLVDRAQGYGMKGIKIDGNSIEDVYNTIQKCKKEIQKNHIPFLLNVKHLEFVDMKKHLE